ncbi:hypothetical protein SCAR479_02702 [Seiridium cardinale]|uniref:Uncharacterized protein n=1 Tax=Seiridium cardinale TaxID=138064 RepID=A0ABR2Y3N5_9PEZI
MIRNHHTRGPQPQPRATQPQQPSWATFIVFPCMNSRDGQSRLDCSYDEPHDVTYLAAGNARIQLGVVSCKEKVHTTRVTSSPDAKLLRNFTF